MRDFSLNTYGSLLEILEVNEYIFQNFQDYLGSPKARSVIMRHDVDRLPENALKMAKIEKLYDIRACYYFRAVPAVFKPAIIEEIAGLGHEIGYHYECLTTAKGDYHAALKDFQKNLKKFQKIYPVKTICMHGSPMSRYDSRSLWQRYDYRDFGIIGEPYFDLDFSKVLYLTDTGRRWDGERFNVRDRVGRKPSADSHKQEINSVAHNNRDKTELFHSTFDIIKALKNDQLPDKIMINTHPQRWSDSYFPWLKELISQNLKNVVKQFLYVKK